MELVRPIVKVGNSAGVILPKEWLNGKARIELIVKPVDIHKELFEILDGSLGDIVGIYLVGSYARGEENQNSDIDVLAITNKISKKITQGKFSILLVPKTTLEEELLKNIFPLLPMILESKTILNNDLISNYKRIELTPENLKWHFDSTKSILKVNEEKIKLDKERGFTGDEVAYSLILRLREAYIVDCIIKKRIWSTKGLMKIIKDISGSLEAYNGYNRVKLGLNKKVELSIEEANKLLTSISLTLKEQEKWLIKRK